MIFTHARIFAPHGDDRAADTRISGRYPYNMKRFGNKMSDSSSDNINEAKSGVVSITIPVWLRDFIGKVAFLNEERLYRVKPYKSKCR